MRGIHPQDKKEAILVGWTIKRLQPPARVVLPLIQAGGAQALPCVQLGGQVLAGQKIAVPKNGQAVSVHASISGTITKIGSFPHPILGEASSIEITSNGVDNRISQIGHERPGWESLSREDLLTLFQDLGLVDLEAEMIPLHLKLKTQSETLIINACESEPYITNEHALMMSHPVEFLKGVDILRRAAAAKRVLIVTEENKSEVADTIKSKIYFLKWAHSEVIVLPSLYPYGRELLIRDRLKKEIKGNSCVFNAASAYSVYEAIAIQKPLYERAITIAGECVVEPKNLWARIGTDFKTLIKACRGLMREPRKVIMGGPLHGIAQETLEMPVIKGTQAILSLPKEVAKPESIEACIRCSRCIDACPVDISPAMITLAAERELFEMANAYGSELCIECGNCTYVCPSKRPMLELIRYALSNDKQSPDSGRYHSFQNDTIRTPALLHADLIP